MIHGIGLFDHIGYASKHLVEGRAVVHDSSLGVRFLQEPELFKSDDSVASGDFQVELVRFLLVRSYSR